MAVVKSQSEKILGVNGLLFGLLIIVAGFAVYGLAGKLRGKALASTATVEAGETA
jgi:hypothetical protein